MLIKEVFIRFFNNNTKDSIIYILNTIIVLLIFYGCTEQRQKVETPNIQQSKIIQHKIPQFDKSRAFDYLLAQTNFGPRYPGSVGHQKCLDFLQRELQKHADRVDLQTFTTDGYDRQVLKLTNVIASFNRNSTKRILLAAHWDTRPRADQDADPKKHKQPILGANDAASGVAVLLEIARHLKEQLPPIGVDIVFFDGEDYGKEGDLKKYLLGSKHFAKNYQIGSQPLFGILLDMIGDKQLIIRKEPNSIKYAPDIVELVWTTAHNLGIGQFSDEIQNPVMDDHLPLNEIGIRTIDIIDFDYPDESNRYWHTTEDTPDKCSPESLEAVGKVLLHVIYNRTE